MSEIPTAVLFDLQATAFAIPLITGDQGAPVW